MIVTRVGTVGLALLALLGLGFSWPAMFVGTTAGEVQPPARPSAGAQDPDPGDATEDKSCLRCHEAVRAEVELDVPHEPAAEEDCVLCHNPHAARYEKLLNMRPRALCFACHREQALEYQDGFVHTPVREGDCSGCHAAHGSEHAGLLHAEGNDLCSDCHQPMFASMEARQVHEPVLEGECLDCHEPHNSAFPNQLTAPANRLCSLCHDPAELTESHSDIPVEGVSCTRCHDAHSSLESGLLLPVAHEPFAEGGCEDCHMVESDTPRLVRVTGARLCKVCHSDTPRPDDAFVHAPVKEGDCAACHEPHASRHAHLLAEPLETSCLSCHEELVQRASAARSVHPTRFEDGGSCTACHQAHSSQEDHLLSAGEIRTCLVCHETQRHGHPLGEGRLDPRTGLAITCVTCHDPHGTAFAYQLRGDESRGLRLECHKAGGEVK